MANYGNLTPGRYRFKVVAANGGATSEHGATTVDVTVTPTFMQSTWFLVLCLSGGVLLVWLAYSLRVRQLTARMQQGLEVRLAERERIARELHDTLLQGFQGLMLRFQAAANRIPVDQPAYRMIEQALRRGDDVLIEGRDRVVELRRADRGCDLSEELRAFSRDLASGPEPRFELTTDGVKRELNPLVLEEARCIGEEAIRNAYRHAGAACIKVAVAYLPGELRLEVRDDGIGIPDAIVARAERPGHFGLIGMRERSERIQGRLTIGAGRAGGTEIALSVPGRAAYRLGPRSSWFGRLRHAL